MPHCQYVLENIAMAKKRRGKRGDQGTGEEKAVKNRHPVEAETNTTAKPTITLRMIMWGGLVVLVVGCIGLFVLSERSNAQRERELRCSTNRSELERKLKEDDLINIQTHLNEVRKYCDADHHADVERLASEVAAKQNAARKETADNESAAVEMWPSHLKDFDRWVTNGEKAADEERWVDASAAISNAESFLNGYKGTSVEQSTEWVDLMRRIAGVHKKIDVQLQRLTDPVAIERDQAAIREAIRRLQEEERGKRK